MTKIPLNARFHVLKFEFPSHKIGIPSLRTKCLLFENKEDTFFENQQVKSWFFFCNRGAHMMTENSGKYTTKSQRPKIVIKNIYSQMSLFYHYLSLLLMPNFSTLFFFTLLFSFLAFLSWAC